MAGAFTHFETMKRVYLELRNLGIIIHEPVKSKIVAIMRTIEPDISRHHGELFEELEKLLLIMAGEGVSAATKNQCVLNACHLIIDKLWIGHNGDIDRWYEPVTDLMVKFKGIKIDGLTIYPNIKNFDAFKTMVEAACLDILQKYLNRAKKGPVNFVALHYSDFKASVYLAAKYAIELTIALVLIAQRNKK